MSKALTAMLDDAWARIEAGTATADAPMRTCVLATVGQSGGARARTVVLRRADRPAATLEIHTDTASDKVAEIAAEPRGTVLFWDAGDMVQIRAEVRLSCRDGRPEEWDRIPSGSRRAYGGTPPPGAPLTAPEAHDPTPDPARFAVLTARIDRLEILHLGSAPHKRAVFDATNGFAGRWIAP